MGKRKQSKLHVPLSEEAHHSSVPSENVEHYSRLSHVEHHSSVPSGAVQFETGQHTRIQAAPFDFPRSDMHQLHHHRIRSQKYYSLTSDHGHCPLSCRSS